MAYFVEIVPAVRDYMNAIETLTVGAVPAVIEGMIDELGRRADDFLRSRPLGHESLRFDYDFPFWDGSELHQFDFIVDGSEMASGVVRVVFVECTLMRGTDEDNP